MKKIKNYITSLKRMLKNNVEWVNENINKYKNWIDEKPYNKSLNKFQTSIYVNSFKIFMSITKILYIPYSLLWTMFACTIKHILSLKNFKLKYIIDEISLTIAISIALIFSDIILSWFYYFNKYYNKIKNNILLVREAGAILIIFAVSIIAPIDALVVSIKENSTHIKRIIKSY